MADDGNHPKTSEDQKLTAPDETNCLKNRLAHAERKLSQMERFNEDLNKQIRLMNEKFHLSKQFLYASVSTQTDWKNEDEKPQSDKVKQKEELDQFLKQIKDDSENSEYSYDSKSNTFLSKSTGWYYYPESQAFFNPKDQRYYKYDDQTKQYTFFCKLDGSKNDEKDEIKKENGCLEVEEGEIEDDEVIFVNRKEKDEPKTSQNHNHRYNCRTEERMIRSFNKVPPVRLIVKKSNSFDVGSLLLISCMGGKIGQHSNCSITVPDKLVSKVHSEIVYDPVQRSYAIQDLCSRNGTALNGKKLGPLERNSLNHQDEIDLADGACVMVAHIHHNRDSTCQECEPGSNLMSDKQSEEGIYANYQQKSARSSMKSLKRKYGLDSKNGQETDGELPEQYRDRAGERKRTVGSDCPYEKTAAGTALDVPLTDRNLGFQMLERMGWKSGQALGKNPSEGRVAPIDIDDETVGTRHGLGFGSK